MEKDKAIKEIKQLKELLDDGILTQDEYDVKSADLKKIILDSENKKIGDKKTPKEYWEKKADEKTKAASPTESPKTKVERKEAVKPENENSLKNISDNKTPLKKQKKEYDSQSFKKAAIISSIICFIVAYWAVQNIFIRQRPAYGIVEAFGYLIMSSLPAIIYLIVKRNKPKDKGTFFALQFTLLILATLGNYNVSRLQKERESTTKSGKEISGEYFSHKSGGKIYTRGQIDKMASEKGLTTDKYVRMYNMIDVTEKVVIYPNNFSNSDKIIPTKYYEYNGEKYTKEWVERAARLNNKSFDDFIRSKGIKEISSN
jgi:hypothetical protein